MNVNPKLLYVIKTWWGLQTLDGFGRIKGPVSYSENPEIAKKCFTAKKPELCDLNDCVLKKERCFPKDTSVWTVPGSSKINNTLTFELFTLKVSMLIYTLPQAFNRYLRILESDDQVVVHFQSGDIINVYDPEIQQTLDEVIELLNYSIKPVVLCGHSFGCVMAQVFACKLLDLKKDISKVYIVGSAAYQWATFRQVNNFINAYYPRFMFFGSMELITTNEYHIDGYLYDKPTTLSVSNFPLMMLSQTIIKLFQTLPSPDTIFQGVLYHESDVFRLHHWSFYHPLVLHYIDAVDLKVMSFGHKRSDIDNDINYLESL